MLAALALGLGAVTGGAAGDESGGPALTEPAAALRASLACHGDLAARTPVLLVPGTALTPAEFSWNYARTFTDTGRPFCTVTLPRRSLGDIQVAAEYVVSAIRTMAQRAGGEIDVVGHSQGGMVGRWALKFWPDTRTKVDDYVALAPSNHGTLDADALCANPTGCAPAIWQQRSRSPFITTLNAGRETYDEVDYTVAYTVFDEIVVPNVELPPGLPRDAVPPASSPLRDGGANVANHQVQAICPAHPADHLTLGTSDAVGHALAVDALDHAGPARAERIDRRVCLRPVQPGVDPVRFPADFAGLVAAAGTAVATTPPTPAEPPLRSYATAASR